MIRPNLDPATQSEFTKRSIRPLLLFEGLFDSGAVRFWTGTSTFGWDGKTFTGAGNLISVSPAEETLHLEATGAKFKLSGVPTSLISLVLDEPVQGREVNVWLGAVDAGRVLVGDPYRIFRGVADQPSINHSAESMDIFLTAENVLRRLKKSNVQWYSATEQKAKFPDDTGFDEVIAQEDIVDTWGSGE